MNKLNPGPRVSHLGRTAIKTLAIHTTDQIQFSCNTPNNNHPAPIISRHQLNLTVGGPRHRKITALRQNSGTNNQPIHNTPTRSYARWLRHSALLCHQKLMPCSTVCYIAALLQMAAPEKKQGPCYIHRSMQPFVELLKALVGPTVFLSPTTLYAHGASRSNACST